MKKVYLSLCSIALASISFSQATINKTSALRAKQTASTKVGGTKETKNPISYSKAIVWQNTFNTPADWVLTNSSNPTQDWVFSNDPAVVSFNSQAAAGFIFASTSVSDGFAVLDSDAGGAGSNQDATITNAVPINLSANPAVVLSFEQISVRYQETTTVRVSGDNGVNWTDYVVNGSQGVNTASTNPELIEINISGVAGGQSQVLIAFNYAGAYDFGWAIDDVKISEALGNDIVLTKGFTHDIVNSYDYSIVAASQIQPMVVGVIANNLGGTVAVGLPLTVVINDGTSNVYNTPTNFDLPLGVTDTIWVTTGFTPVTNKTYSVTFSVPTDDNTANNVTTPVSFSTSNSTYAHDFDNGIFRFDQDDETSMGNIFEIIAPVSLPAVSVKFAVGTTATTANILVSRFNPDDAAFTGVQSMEYIYDLDFTIPAGDIGSGNFTTVPFATPLELEAGWYYAIQCKKYVGTDRIFLAGSDAGDDDLSTVCFGPFGAGNAVNQFIGFGFSPAVRMSFPLNSSLNENEAFSSFSVFPNPATENIAIDYALKAESVVNVSITDLSGKIVYAVNLGNKTVGANSLNVNTAAFANGIYVVNVLTNNGIATEKLVIRK